jgi:octaprenyl-diphosphate synthase
VGDDFREGKITLPVILAMNRGSEAERVFWHRTLDEHNQRDDDFAFALDVLNRRNTLHDALDRARHYGAIARDALGLFPDHPVKRALLGIVDFTVERGF